MSKKSVFSAALLVVGIMAGPASAANDTRLGFGFGLGQCTDSELECSSQEFFRFSVEKAVSRHFSIDLAGDVKLFSLEERFTSYGVNVKYRFSAQPYSFFIKAGPHYYERREMTGIFRYEGRSGVGAAAALGWQNAPSDWYGFGAEIWYRTLDEFDAYGASVFLTYAFNLF